MKECTASTGAFSPLTGAIRALTIDAVEAANSGHPGAPLGMAEMAEVLWRRHLSHNPQNPKWCNRDRFVLSNGHASMLLYALLHLTGYDLSITDIKNFRQLHSKTPGHPELGYTQGVETTTGPLGQGLANAVGMAIAEKTLSAEFNRPGHKIVDHHSYVFMGDGCLMEGISHEAAALAGTLGLGKLIAFWDDNGISIDGHVTGWFDDDTPRRFLAYGWQVITAVDGHDAAALDAAIKAAKLVTDKPTLICCKTVIGRGSPNKKGSHDCHGAPLGAAEAALTKAAMDWKHPPFHIPAEIYAAWDAKASGAAAEADWQQRFSAYAKEFPLLAAEFDRRVIRKKFPTDWEKTKTDYLSATRAKAENIASRKASQNAIAAFLPVLPELFGGSADLASSNLTLVAGSKPLKAHDGGGGNYCYYGVREFGMTAIANGIALHGGFIPYTATFLMFSDYARNAIRMAALMKQRQIMVYTHDSIGLGEDGPTHQPIEQIPSLRLIPGLQLWRPADATETAVAWIAALECDNAPTVLALSRQNLPTLTAGISDGDIAKGGYVLEENVAATITLIATGSELKLAVDVAALLQVKGIVARIVSMPSTQVFDSQSADYKAAVLGKVTRLAIEAAHPDFWWKYVGLDGAVIGINRFGESAPASQLFKHFGLDVAGVVAKIEGHLEKPIFGDKVLDNRKTQKRRHIKR